MELFNMLVNQMIDHLAAVKITDKALKVAKTNRTEGERQKAKEQQEKIKEDADKRKEEKAE